MAEDIKAKIHKLGLQNMLATVDRILAPLDGTAPTPAHAESMEASRVLFRDIAEAIKAIDPVAEKVAFAKGIAYTLKRHTGLDEVAMNDFGSIMTAYFDAFRTVMRVPNPYTAAEQSKGAATAR